MGKSAKYLLKMNKSPLFEGRLIGFIDDEECRAIINTEDAASKIFTAEGLKVHDSLGTITSRKRFVMATENRLKGKREVYISPKISYSFVTGKIMGFNCEDDNEYRLEEIV